MSVLAEHLVDEIETAEARSFRTEDRSAELHALAGECAGVFAGELLIHAIEIAYFTCANADVTSGDVGVGANITPELEHERLTESHDFSVATSAEYEVCTALAAAHGESGKSVFEGLLEAEELEDREIHGWMEAEATFVRADRVVELDTVTQVYVHFALVVDPGHTESEDAIGLDKALDDFRFLKLWMLVVDALNRGEYFFHGLQVFLFTRMLGL